MLTITGAGTVISYALYTVAPRTTQVFGTDDLIYTTIFVLYGVFRYLYLIHASKQVENPTTLSSLMYRFLPMVRYGSSHAST